MIIFYFASIIKLFLCQAMRFFTFFSDSPPHPTGMALSYWLGFTYSTSFWHLIWGPATMTNLTRTRKNKYKYSLYYISFIVAGHNVDLFALRAGVLFLKVALCFTLLAVCVPRCCLSPMGDRAKVIIWLYFATLAYDMMEWLAVELT